MRTFEVELANGRVYTVQAPDGTPEASLIQAAARQAMLEAEQPFFEDSEGEQTQRELMELLRRPRPGPTPEKPGFFSSVGSGMGMYGDIPDAFALLTAGDDEARAAAEERLLETDTGPRYTLDELKEKAKGGNYLDAAGELWGLAKQTTGESIGMMAAPVAGSLLSPVTGGTSAVAGWGALGGLYLTQNLQRQAQERERARQEGKPVPDWDYAAATAAAGGQAVLDRLLLGVAGILPGAKKTGEEAFKQVAKLSEEGLLKSAGKGTLKTALVESPTEIGQQALERLQAGLSLSDEEAQKELTEAGILGLLPAPLFGTVGRRMDVGRARAQVAEKEAADQAAAAAKQEGIKPSEFSPLSEFVGPMPVDEAQSEERLGPEQLSFLEDILNSGQAGQYQPRAGDPQAVPEGMVDFSTEALRAEQPQVEESPVDPNAPYRQPEADLRSSESPLFDASPTAMVPTLIQPQQLRREIASTLSSVGKLTPVGQSFVNEATSELLSNLGEPSSLLDVTASIQQRAEKLRGSSKAAGTAMANLAKSVADRTRTALNTAYVQEAQARGPQEPTLTDRTTPADDTTAQQMVERNVEREGEMAAQREDADLEMRIADVDAREQGRRDQAPLLQREQLLDDVLTEQNNTDLPGTFATRLQKQGMPEATPDELRRLERAQEARDTLGAPEPEPVFEPDITEQAIPERKPKPVFTQKPKPQPRAVSRTGEATQTEMPLQPRDKATKREMAKRAAEPSQEPMETMDMPPRKSDMPQQKDWVDELQKLKARREKASARQRSYREAKKQTKNPDQLDMLEEKAAAADVEISETDSLIAEAEAAVAAQNAAEKPAPVAAKKPKTSEERKKAKAAESLKAQADKKAAQLARAQAAEDAKKKQQESKPSVEEQLAKALGEETDRFFTAGKIAGYGEGDVMMARTAIDRALDKSVIDSTKAAQLRAILESEGPLAFSDSVKGIAEDAARKKLGTPSAELNRPKLPERTAAQTKAVSDWVTRSLGVMAGVLSPKSVGKFFGKAKAFEAAAKQALPANIEKMIRQGTNLNTLMKELAKTAPKELMPLIKLLTPLVTDKTLVYHEGGRTDGRLGSFFVGPDGMRVVLYTGASKGEPSNGLDYETLLHETAHAAIGEKYITAQYAAETLVPTLTPEQKKEVQALIEFEKTWRDFVEQMTLYKKAGNKLSSATEYAMTDPDEFFAMGQTSPEFRADLANMRYGADPSKSLWDRFVRFVKDLFSDMKGSSDVLDGVLLASNNLIKELGTFDSLNYPNIDKTYGPRQLELEIELNRIGNAAVDASTPAESKAVLDSIKDVSRKLAAAAPGGERNYAVVEQALSNSSNSTWRKVLGVLPFPQVADLSKKYLPKTTKAMGEMFNRYTGELTRLNSKLDNATVKPVIEWYKANPAKGKQVSDLLIAGDQYKIDFRKPRTYYVKKTLDESTERAKAYDKFAPIYKAMDQDAKDIYRNIRQTYDNILEDHIKSIGKAVVDAGGTAASAKKIMDQFRARLAETQGVEGYFPRYREGDYILKYTKNMPDGQGQEQVFLMFELADERNAMRDAVAADPDTVKGTVEVFKKFQRSTYEAAPKGTFVGDVLEILKGADGKALDSAVEEKIMRLVADLSPQGSILKNFKRRRNEYLVGFDVSVPKVFAESTKRMLRRELQMRFTGEVMALQKALGDELKPILKRGDRSADIAQNYSNELMDRLKFAADPVLPEWSQNGRTMTYAMTLGLNISSAMLDMFAIPMTIYPHLKGMYSKQSVWGAIGEASRAVMGSPRTHKIESYITAGKTDKQLRDLGIKERIYAEPSALNSIDNYDYSDPSKLPPALKNAETLVRVMHEMGQFQRFNLTDNLDSLGESSMNAKLNGIMGFMMQASERFRRESSMLAAYNLELEKVAGNSKPTEAQMEAAAHKAIEMAELTSGAMSSLASARYAQSGVGSILMMYKRYGATMMYWQASRLREMLNSENSKEVRMQAFAQLGTSWAMSALLAGVAGSPMMGIVAAIYDMFAGDEDDDFRTMLQANLGLGATYGLVNKITGWNVSQRISLTDMVVRADPYSDGKAPAEYFATLLGGPAWGTAERVWRGLNQVRQGNIERGIEQMLPAAAGSFVKATRFATEGATTLDGEPILADVDAMSVLGQAIGFAPAEVSRAQQFISYRKAKDRRIGEERSRILGRIYMSRKNGDMSGYRKALEERREFNERMAGYDPTLAITRDMIDRSTKIRQGQDANRVFGIVPSDQKAWIRDAQRVLGEYNGE